MNKNRRKALREWVQKVETWAANGYDLKSELENICSEEQDCFDNMPENLQGSTRGMDAEEAIDIMNDAIESMNSAIESAEEAVGCIEEI